jgi:hypothetical protein
LLGNGSISADVDTTLFKEKTQAKNMTGLKNFNVINNKSYGAESHLVILTEKENTTLIYWSSFIFLEDEGIVV